MRRFVILLHDWPFLHWDLLLEQDEKLLAWRILEEPEPGKICHVEGLADHRLFYLDYTGPISGDRGTVERWDEGELVETFLANGIREAILDSRRFKQRLRIRLTLDKISIDDTGCS